jgi:stage II sporulation protein AA (anti-sigma F factor antagonist)
MFPGGEGGGPASALCGGCENPPFAAVAGSHLRERVVCKKEWSCEKWPAENGLRKTGIFGRRSKMEFDSHKTADAIEARLRGRLEFTDHDRLRDIVALLDGAKTRRFVVDVSGLEFIDSAGLGMILILQEEAEQKNIQMVVRGPRDSVRRSIDLAKIGEIVTIEN